MRMSERPRPELEEAARTCERLAVPVAPFLIAEALASNIGGTATLVGDPPNIIIASRAGLSYNDFLVHLAPLVLVLLVVFIGLCRWLGVVGRSEQGAPTRTSSTTEAGCAGYKFADVLLVGGNTEQIAAAARSTAGVQDTQVRTAADVHFRVPGKDKFVGHVVRVPTTSQQRTTIADVR